jgi:hypothetical protein
MKLLSLAMYFAVLVGGTGAWCQATNSSPASCGSTISQTDQASSPKSERQSSSQTASQPVSESDLSAANGATSATLGSPITPWLPNAVNGETGSISFFEGGETNFVSVGIAMAGTYDDNAFSDNRDKIGNVGYLVTPNISLRESRPRTDLILSYSPGFTFNQRTSPQYTAAHDLNFSVQYRLAEHVTARLREGLVYGATSFNALGENQFEPGASVLHQSNLAVVTPLEHRFASSSGADLIDQIAEKTMIGLSGNFARLHFLGGSASSSLLDNQTWGADGFYSTRVSSHSSLGLTYSYQNLATLGSLGEHTNSNSGLIFYTLYPKPRVTLSFFAGPSYTTNRLGSTTQSMWLVDGGATLGWQGARTNIQFSAIHNVSDGGGLTGAARTYSVNVVARRQFDHQFVGTVGLSYSENSVLANLPGNHFYAVDGTAGIEKTIRQRFAIGLIYGRNHQTFANSGALSNNLVDHNRAWVNVSYSFSHPLGI